MTYRQIFSLTVAVAGALFLTSCDSFLDRNPVSEANTGNFYRNADDMERAVFGAYAALRDVYGEWWVYGDLRSDISTLPDGGDKQRLNSFEMAPSNSFANIAWNDHYEAIARSNVVLGRLSEVEGLDASQADQFRGEALFLRSLLHFNLVRVFGPVPLVAEEISTVEAAFQARDQPRTPVSEVYDQIVSDLESAAQLLPESYEGDDQGRATSGAANALLGKVHLTRQDFAAAAGVLEEVINSGTYRLLEDYADLFENENAVNDEIIFTVLYQGNGTGEGSPFTWFFTPPEYVEGVPTIGNPQNTPTATLLEAYEPGDDERRDATVVTEFVNPSTGDTLSEDFNKKYFSPDEFFRGGDDDWPVLRYADVLLMYAEALNEMGQTEQAYEPLNGVRERAGLDPLSGLSQSAFRDAVYHERMVELAFEGHRWFDLVRTGRAIEEMADATPSYNIEEHQLVFPVPQQQIDVSAALEQNPGY